MTTVAIEYCVPCGQRQRALDVADHLRDTFGQELEGVSLVTGDSGVFTVSVDGDPTTRARTLSNSHPTGRTSRPIHVVCAPAGTAEPAG